MKLNDEELIRQHFTTSPNICFEILYKRYVNKVYRRCLSLTKDTENAQDYTHDIFIRTFQRLERYEGRSTFSTWLYSICFNYCLEQLKFAKRMPMASLDQPEMPFELADSRDSDALEERLQLLTQALGLLSSEESDLLRMKYQQGLPVHQIAHQLGLQESAVKMRLKRSRQKAFQYCKRVANH